jgi:hypothetical protein
MKFIKNKKLFSFLLIFLFSCFFVLSANFHPASAEGALWADMEACQKSGDCQLNDFARLAVNATGWMLGIVGSLALLMFIYGGVVFLISAGNSEKVTQAKGIIIGAVIGITIVFTSYMIINFVFTSLKIETGGTIWSTIK